MAAPSGTGSTAERISSNLHLTPTSAPRILAYLEALCAALIARDRFAITRLGADALSVQLPAQVRDEIARFARGQAGPTAAPLHTLHLYYQRAELARDWGAESRRKSVAAPPVAPPRATVAPSKQIELPLFAA